MANVPVPLFFSMAVTYVYVRGNEKEPDTSKPIPPGVPAALPGAAFEIKPVPLPPAAFAPDSRDFVIKETRAAFPDQRNELIKMHHADDAVLAEFWLKGTHEGEFRGIPPTHKAFTCQCLAVFMFEGEGLVCERVYFDTATILSQLGLLPA